MDENVKIIYEAVVRGQEKVEDLARKNEQLNEQIETQRATVQRLTKEHEKQQSMFVKAGQSVKSLRREFAIFGFALGSLAGLMATLSKGSSDLAAAMEDLGRESARATKPMGDWLAKFTRLLGGKGFTAPDLSVNNQARLANMFSDIESLRGRSQAALLEKLRAEEIQLADQVGDKWNTTFKRVFDERKKLLLENLRLEELGLKRMEQIRKDFQKDIVQSFRGGTSDTIFNFLQGERQSGADVMKSFTTGINRAIAEAFSQSLFTTFASGGNFFQNFKSILTGRTPQVVAAETTAKATENISRKNDEMLAVLRQIAECTCSTAQRMGTMTATITPPKKSTLDKIGSVANLVGSVASLGGMLGAGGGGGGVQQPPADIIYNPGKTLHRGGWVPSFPSGGEVGINAQPGEFVVRKAVAQDNKDFLKELNSGARPVRGTTNVFMIKANDAQSFSQMLSSPSSQAELEIQLIRRIMQNGEIRSILKNFAR